MKKSWLCLFLHLAAASGRASSEDRWFDPAFLEAATLDASSGFILTPSPDVLASQVTLGSIHRYQVKVARGFWDRLELGLTADLDGYRLVEDGVRKVLLMGRLRLLSAERHGISLSLGADQVGGEDLGLKSLSFIPDAGLEPLDRVYAVAGAVLPFFPSLMLSAGWGTGSRPVHYFGNASLVVMPGLLVMAEYDGVGTNFGGRLLLSSRVKLDLAFIHSQSLDTQRPLADVLENNIRFGISYSEIWSLLPKKAAHGK